jgi:hypothetical protein
MSSNTGNIQELASIVQVIVAFGSVLVMYLGYKYLPWYVSRKSFVESIEKQSEEFYNSISHLRDEARDNLGKSLFKTTFVIGLGISLILMGVYAYKYHSELTRNELFLAWYFLLAILWVIVFGATYLCITLSKKCGYQIAELHNSVSLVFTFSWGLLWIASGRPLKLLMVYFLVLGSIVLVNWIVSKKENKYVREKWKNLPPNEKNVLVRVYTDFGEVVGYLHDVFNDTWLHIQDYKFRKYFEYRMEGH